MSKHRRPAGPDQVPLLKVPASAKPPQSAAVPATASGIAPTRASLPWSPDQAELLPARVREVLGEENLACVLLDMREQLDFSAVVVSDKSDVGRPGYSPVMMTLLLIYAYARGVHSSREIERRCATDLGFRYIAGGYRPDHSRICEFRTQHLEAFKALFLQTLRLAQAAKLVSLGHIAVDGSKFLANASKHKAMSYGRMDPAMEQLDRQIKQLIEEAEAIDAEEDRRYGDQRGDELPPEIADPKERKRAFAEAKQRLKAAEVDQKMDLVEEKEKRIAKIEETKAVLEEAAREKAKAEEKPEETAVPDEKAQRNFTDPDSRIMPKSGAKGGFVQAYNVQAAVDADSQIIVAQEVVQAANDKEQLLPMVEQVIANTGKVPKQVSADNGYLSEDQVTSVEEMGVEAFVAPGRQKHGETQGPARGRPAEALTWAERNARKLTGRRGKRIYARRKVTVEPTFGQIKNRGFRGFSLRGLAKVRGEMALVCAVHNLLKIIRAKLKAETTPPTLLLPAATG